MSICEPVHALVIQPTDPRAANLPGHRLAESQIRPAAELVNRLLSLNPQSLNTAREPGQRVVGTCRHFAVLSCALLRHRGIAARVRCGFATYFQPGRGLDHWITEYRNDSQQRWVRIDTEILGQQVIEHPEDLRPGQFLTGGEAWLAFRRGTIDATKFGVYGTENWGPSEIRGNAVRDLVALNKIETLPWDSWGRMTEAYEGHTGPDYDDLLDELGRVSDTDNPGAFADMYAHPHLRVPDRLIG